MTIFEEMYKETPDLLKFYRFEGLNSYMYFPSKNTIEYNDHNSNYVYFSQNIQHHQYYVRKKIRQLITTEMGRGYNANKKSFLDFGNFNEMVKRIENCQVTEKMLSIEFGLSPTFAQILEKNSALNTSKEKADRRIEYVDPKKYGGGFGFCEEWLTVYNLLTYFYGFQRITKENLLEFLHLYRFYLIKEKRTLSATNFLLDESCRTIKLNEMLFDDFSKYELMNALQIIVEKKLYFHDSMFSTNPDQAIKKIIQAYSLEREHLLELSESIYRRTLNK